MTPINQHSKYRTFAQNMYDNLYSSIEIYFKMFINKVHNACRSSGNLQEETSPAWDVVRHLFCRGSRILVCGSCSILIWSIEEGSSPLLPPNNVPAPHWVPKMLHRNTKLILCPRITLGIYQTFNWAMVSHGLGTYHISGG